MCISPQPPRLLSCWLPLSIREAIATRDASPLTVLFSDASGAVAGVSGRYNRCGAAARSTDLIDQGGRLGMRGFAAPRHGPCHH
jgi:hypothetical protein